MRGVGCGFAFGGGEFTELDARERGILFAEAAKCFVDDFTAPLGGIKRQRAGEKLVEDYSQRIDVTAGVNVADFGVGLFGAHIRGSAHEIPFARDHGGEGIAFGDGFGNSEIDNAWSGLAVNVGNENILWFQVAMDESFLMGVLNTCADLGEEFDALTDGKAFLIAVDGDGDAGNILHDEVGKAVGSCAGVVDLCDGGVIHARQGLAFGFEACEKGCVGNASAN